MKSTNQFSRTQPVGQLGLGQILHRWRAGFLCWRVVVAIVLTCGVPHIRAGTLSTDFDPNQALPGSLYGTAELSPNGGAPNGAGTCLQFDTQNGQSGLLVLNEIDPGLQVQGFVTSFDLLMGNSENSALHGDGFSFSFVPSAEVPKDVLPRAFLGTGSGLKIAFVTYNHQAVTNTDLTVQVSLNNQLLGLYPAPYLNTGTNYAHVTITARSDGSVDLVYGSHMVFSNLFCFTPTQGQFCLAADSQVTVFVGDSIDLMWLQHLSITTAVTNQLSLTSASPLGPGVAPNAPIRFQIQNNSTSLDPITLALKLNDAPVPAAALSVAQSGNLNTVSYQPPTIFPPSTTVSVELTYRDNAQPPNSFSNSYSFSTYPYTTLPASYSVTSDSVNRADGNTYYLYLYQSASPINESLSVAEQMVSGAITNAADLSGSANADGGFNWPSNHTINFSTAGSPGEFLGADNGSGGTLFPNNLGSYYAVEILTYLQLAPGAYTFGVDAVSNFVQGTGIPVEAGFKLTAGPSPRNFLAPPVASFDNSYPEGNAEFSFVVTNAGLYPFRLLAFSGPGDGSLEWYMVTNGTRVDLVTGLGAANVFGTPLITHPWIESSPTPSPGDNFVPASSVIEASIANGTATTVPASIAMTLNGLGVVPQTVTQLSVTNLNNTPAGQTVQTITHLTYTPPGGLGDGTSNFVTLSFSDTTGLRLTNSWKFSTVAALKDPHLLVIEAEDYFTNFPADPAVDNSNNDANFTAPDPNTGLMVHQWVFGSMTVTDYWSFAYGDYPNVVADPTGHAINIPGYSGRGYMVPLPNVNYNVNTNIYNGPGGTNVPADCGMTYNVYFQDPGIYYIWCRGWGDSSPGPAQNKSCNFGIDGVEQSSSFRMGGGPGFPQGAWNWDNINAQSSQPCYLTVASSGWHVINLWMREDGFVCDKFLLTTNHAYVPSGLGPAENPGGPPSPSVILSIATTAGGARISWTGGVGVLQESVEVNGPYTNVVGGSSSPVLITAGAARRFYRVLQ